MSIKLLWYDLNYSSLVAGPIYLPNSIVFWNFFSADFDSFSKLILEFASTDLMPYNKRENHSKVEKICVSHGYCTASNRLCHLTSVFFHFVVP